MCISTIFTKKTLSLTYHLKLDFKCLSYISSLRLSLSSKSNCEQNYSFAHTGITKREKLLLEAKVVSPGFTMKNYFFRSLAQLSPIILGSFCVQLTKRIWFPVCVGHARLALCYASRVWLLAIISLNMFDDIFLSPAGWKQQI